MRTSDERYEHIAWMKKDFDDVKVTPAKLSSYMQHRAEIEKKQVVYYCKLPTAYTVLDTIVMFAPFFIFLLYL